MYRAYCDDRELGIDYPDLDTVETAIEALLNAFPGHDYYYVRTDLDVEEIERWRAPDEQRSRFPQLHAIWYGPAGIEGDCATEVVEDFGGFEVSRYNGMTGYSDNPEAFEAEYGETPICKATTWVDSDETNDIRVAAAIGTARLCEQGGTETFVATLPTVE